MSNNIIKVITLYFILIVMFIVIKPQIFYYDNNKTILKKWNMFLYTNDYNDLLNFHSFAILIAFISFILLSY